MKSDKKQEFKSISVISMFILIGLSVLLLAPVWNDESSEHINKALNRAEGLAYQILESRKGTSRGPASATELNHLSQDSGRVGADPWGHQYHFKFFNLGGNDQTKILVWSAGPNGKVDSDDKTIDSIRDSLNPTFLGDDLGIAILVK